jgi:hypothetical protein
MAPGVRVIIAEYADMYILRMSDLLKWICYLNNQRIRHHDLDGKRVTKIDVMEHAKDGTMYMQLHGTKDSDNLFKGSIDDVD